MIPTRIRSPVFSRRTRFPRFVRSFRQRGRAGIGVVLGERGEGRKGEAASEVAERRGEETEGARRVKLEKETEVPLIFFRLRLVLEKS